MSVFPVNRRRFPAPLYPGAAVCVVVLLAASACGGGGDEEGSVEAGAGVSMEVRHTEPLRTGQPVRWALVLRNDTSDRLDLEFPSGQDGDVVLSQGGREVYRWSAGRVFTAAVRQVEVGPNDSRTFALEDTEFEVPPGRYDLVATLAVSDEVAPAEKSVAVTR